VSTDARASAAVQPSIRRVPALTLRWPSPRYIVGVVVLAGAYFGAAKLGQTLRYTASVSAIWPPAGLGIAALYLWGLRWWPGIFLGELVVNGQLLIEHPALPIGSLAGQQAGNMAEIIVGAWLLRRLIGPGASLDRAAEVGGLIVAAGTATAISATAGTMSMWAGGVIDISDAPTFWRTWFLGDTAGALVVLPLVLTWLGDPKAAWRRMRTPEGALLVTSVVVLAVVAVTSDAPVTYVIFPALIWAAFRFGPPGVTLCIAITATLTIGITADEVGPFFKQPIDDRTLSTQLYILVAALTSLFLSAVVSERERSAAELADAKRHEDERALEERRRIARELHDSVSQALFSSVLHTRAAEKALEEEGGSRSAPLGEALSAIGELTRRAQREMRMFIFEWGPDGIGDGLVPAFVRHASSLRDESGLVVEVVGPQQRLPLARVTQTQLYGIGREALANVVRHSGADSARVRVEASNSHVTMEVADDGNGFDPSEPRPGHYGLESMRSRAEEIAGVLKITSAVGRGTVIRVEVPVESSERPDSSGA
jgi:signal transduction histidine kinase